MNNPCGLILDFGGVVTRTLFETHALTEKSLKLPQGSLTWQGPFAPDGDARWVAMQNEEITEREYWQTRTREVGNMIGRNWTKMSEFVVAARGSADPTEFIRPEAIETIEVAKAAGVRLAILSNELDLFYGSGFRARLAILSQFDAIVDATYTEILKPDVEAYLLCANELGIPPDRCVFVDDQKRNVVGAKAAGMRAIQFDVKQPSQSFANALNILTELTKEHDHA